MSIIHIYETSYICRLDGGKWVLNAFTPISFERY